VDTIEKERNFLFNFFLGVSVKITTEIKAPILDSHIHGRGGIDQFLIIGESFPRIHSETLDSIEHNWKKMKQMSRNVCFSVRRTDRNNRSERRDWEEGYREDGKPNAS
jgi:hypothetical protein